VKSGRILHLRFTKLLILANGVFWLVFVINFLANSRAYKPHPITFEERSPLFVYYGRALPAEQYMSPLMRTTRTLQWPSLFSARPYFWYFDRHGIYGEQLYGGISVTGYYVLIVCALSFLQWYVVGWLIDWVRNRTNVGPTRAPNDRGYERGLSLRRGRA
jgi:hypothetical protein